MPIIAAFITGSIALLVPFITFYLNRSAGPSAVQIGPIGTALTVSPTIRLLVVVPAAFVLAVPAGFSAFGAAIAFNLFTMPDAQELTLFSLDGGLTGGAIFGLSSILYAGFTEPVLWWVRLPWFKLAHAVFFATLGFLVALVGNSIWAMAHGLELEDVHVIFDSLDAGLTSGLLASIAAFACVKVEELRNGGLTVAVPQGTPT